MPNDITGAYNWAITECNKPNVGYSMTYREQQTVGGITYYDCSSFIWYALKQGGDFSLNPPAFTTVTMYSILSSLGFNIIVPDATTQTQEGDILWYDYGGGVNGHTEMVYQGGVGQAITMGAHGSSLPLPDQVSIHTYYTPNSNWQFLARWGGGIAHRQWIYLKKGVLLSRKRRVGY